MPIIGQAKTTSVWCILRSDLPGGSTGQSLMSVIALLQVMSVIPQIDIIGAMVIVWRVRGKIIRSVLCNIVCNNCAQCNAHTYEQT